MRPPVATRFIVKASQQCSSFKLSTFFGPRLHVERRGPMSEQSSKGAFQLISMQWSNAWCSARMSEWESFTPQIIKVEKLPSVPGSVDVLRIKAGKGGAFALGILGTPNSGQPRRHAVNGAIQLLPDQWARLTVNARHTSYSGQHYSETIFNVTFGATVPSNRFLLGPPDHDLDLKADLF